LLRAKFLTSLLVALTGVLLSRTADAGVTPPVDRIQRVFPFEVGQQYQFKASGDYYHWFHGGILPAGEVAEITITDTIIDGETWLRIPYWNPFGVGMYRLGDLSYLNRESDSNWVIATPPSGIFMVPILHLTGDYPGSNEYWITATYFAYENIIEQKLVCGDFRCYDRPYLWGWYPNDPDSVFRVKWPYNSDDPNWGAEVRFGEYGPGSATHGSHRVLPQDERKLWAIFRPKSDDPWPTLDPVVGPVGINAPTKERPERADLSLSTFPNPFNPTVTIRYSVPSTGTVSLCVYDITGRFVRELAGSSLTAGVHTVVWNGSDETGRAVGSGVYIVRLRHDVQTASESAVTCCGTAVQRITLVR